jgi:hypothetical protein
MSQIDNDVRNGRESNGHIGMFKMQLKAAAHQGVGVERALKRCIYTPPLRPRLRQEPAVIMQALQDGALGRAHSSSSTVGMFTKENVLSTP